MTRFVAAMTAFALALCVAGGACAEATPRAKELARRYIVALDMRKNVMPMMDSMMAAMTDQELAQGDFTAEERALVAKIVRDAVNGTMEGELLDEMLTDMEPMLAETFTEQELQAMVDFYESPIGRSMMAKMPAFAERSTSLMVKFAPKMQAEIERRVQENLSALNLHGK